MSDWNAPPPPPPPPPQYGQPAPGQAQYAYGGPFDVRGRPVASWGKRFGARIIDGLIVGVPFAIIFFVLMAVVIGSADPVTGEPSDAAAAGLALGMILIGLAAMVVPIAYFVFFNGNERGQTPGKMVFKIQVRDAATGGPAGYGKAAVRELVFSLPSAVCGLWTFVAGLWPLWDNQRQGIHDKAATTTVIDIG